MTLRSLPIPSMEVVGKDGHVGLAAELPGLDRENIRIALADAMPVISGEKRQDENETQESRKVTERADRGSTRAVNLPAGIEPEDTEAGMDRSVLSDRETKPVGIEAP